MPKARGQSIGMSYRFSGGQQQAGIRYTGRRSLEQSQLMSTGHRVVTGTDSEVAQDIGDVVIDRAAADGESLRYLAVRLSAGQQPEYFVLALGQCGDTGTAPSRFPRGLLRHRHDRSGLG
jgi:hypothetical protein